MERSIEHQALHWEIKTGLDMAIQKEIKMLQAHRPEGYQRNINLVTAGAHQTILLDAMDADKLG